MFTTVPANDNWPAMRFRRARLAVMPALALAIFCVNLQPIVVLIEVLFVRVSVLVSVS